MKRVLGLMVAVLWLSAVHAYDPTNRQEYLAKIAQAEAYYNHKCATVAGEKIYKTVSDVEGGLLMKVRPRATDREYREPNWPGAAFAREADGDSYIMSFLGYEWATSANGKYLPITRSQRGLITPDSNPSNPANLPGYGWVDVVDEKDGKRYRYTLVKKIVGRLDPNSVNVQVDLRRNPDMDLNTYRTVLDRQIAPEPAPRYGVTFEDHVVPEERAMWVASSTVKAIDIKAHEVLGELTRYAMSYVHVASSSNPGPWLSAYECPALGGPTANYATRLFVDQVLIPAKEH